MGHLRAGNICGPMQCPSCKADLADDARFCSICGTKVRKECGSCQTLNEAIARHCSFCGLPLGDDAAPDSASPAPPETDSAIPQGEWRQVTILFCDVVGSTKMTELMDVEDLHELWATFQHACASVVERYGGHIAKFLGDGFVAYFGYPRAYEDAPQRGAHAALGVLKRLRQLNEGQWKKLGIQVRLRSGLHTGLVVAGEMGGGSTPEMANIVGMAPNIAARLEAFAQPDTVAVSAATKTLIDDQFSFEPLGSHELAGVDQPVEIFSLTGEREAREADGAQRPEGEKLVGRDKEIASIVERWRAVEAGGPAGMVRVVGDPGIGKSAVLSGFLAEASPDPAQLVVLTCSNLDRDSAFGPLIRMFEREFDFNIREEGQEKAGHIEQWLQAQGFGDEKAVAAIVGLFVEDEEAARDPGGDAREIRREIFSALTAWFAARKPPLLLVLEDAHWADPSTLELMDRMWRRSGDGGPGLFLEISRPDATPPWASSVDLTVNLVRLAPEGCEVLVRRITSGVPVETNLLNHIIERSGGVPLFVEELTRWVLASGQLVERNGRLRSVRDVTSLDIPASLADSLTERLDGLGPAKKLAQAAAVIGREFSLEELAAVADESGEALQRSLERLMASRFLRANQQGDSTLYYFHHILYRRSAYNSLLRARRKALHTRYVRWIDSQPTRLAAMRPEILALHCENAGLEMRAVESLLEAGERASRASASQEAERHLTKGLAILERQPDGVANKTLALRMNVLLGPVLMMNRGTGAPETSATYDRALALCHDLPQTQWHFPAYWGWWRIAANFRQMAERAEWLLDVVEGMHEPEYSLEAHHCRWVNSFMIGDHKACIRHVQAGMEIYDGGEFDTLGTLYGGHDPKVCGVGDMALSKWLMGEPDTAVRLADEALAWGERSGHLGSHLHGLDIALMLRHYLRDTAGTRALARQLQSLGEMNDLDDYRLKGQIFQGWCSLDDGDAAKAAELIAESLEVIRKTVTQEDYPVYFCMHAQAQTAIGRFPEAQKVLDEGLGMSEQQGLAYWTAELVRQSAETLIASGDGDLAAIDALLDCAAVTAEGQGALSLELRTAFCRARWRSADHQPSMDKLKAILARFTEGHDTRDYREAAGFIAAADADGA